MNWQVPKMWEGDDVWILGGGPSVAKEFGIPDSVVQAVVDGTSPASIYSPYMKAIHSKHVIGINAAFLIGDWIDVIFFGDNNFFLKNQDALFKHPAMKVTCYPKNVGVNWVKYLGRDTS